MAVKMAPTARTRQIPLSSRLIVEIGFSEEKLWSLALQFGRIWGHQGGAFQQVIEFHHNLIAQPLPIFQVDDTTENRQKALLHMFQLVVGDDVLGWLTEVRSRFHSVLFYSWLRKELGCRTRYGSEISTVSDS